MATAQAWIMKFTGGHRAAVGALELMHLLADTPELHAVPQCPAHCNRVFVWEDQVLPVFDLHRWLAGDTAVGGAIEAQTHFGIFRYRVRPADPLAFGGLVMSDIPSRAEVDDSQACDLPDALDPWRGISISCFEHDGRPIPVLDLPILFSGPAEST